MVWLKETGARTGHLRQGVSNAAALDSVRKRMCFLRAKPIQVVIQNKKNKKICPLHSSFHSVHPCVTLSPFKHGMCTSQGSCSSGVLFPVRTVLGSRPSPLYSCYITGGGKEHTAQNVKAEESVEGEGDHPSFSLFQHNTQSSILTRLSLTQWQANVSL